MAAPVGHLGSGHAQNQYGSSFSGGTCVTQITNRYGEQFMSYRTHSYKCWRPASQPAGWTTDGRPGWQQYPPSATWRGIKTHYDKVLIRAFRAAHTDAVYELLNTIMVHWKCTEARRQFNLQEACALAPSQLAAITKSGLWTFGDPSNKNNKSPKFLVKSDESHRISQ